MYPYRVRIREWRDGSIPKKGCRVSIKEFAVDTHPPRKCPRSFMACCPRQSVHRAQCLPSKVSNSLRRMFPCRNLAQCLWGEEEGEGEKKVGIGAGRVVGRLRHSSSVESCMEIMEGPSRTRKPIRSCSLRQANYLSAMQAV